MEESASHSGRISGDGPRGFTQSKSMPMRRNQSLDSKRSGALPEVAGAAAVSYTTTDDFISRVEIYRGRHSVVWNAVCKHTKRPLILKGYVKAKMTERNFHQVKREIKLMQQIEYNGAVKLMGTFEDLIAIYLVQEICQKGDLFKKLIRSGGVMEEKYVAAEVILPLLLTLEHLHKHLIFHRDIKPENIFFARDGAMKLGDFGLAIDAAIERPKSRVGTLDYMAPEVVSLPTADDRKRMEQQGKPVIEQNYTEKVDVWACGILAYELLVGRPPFEVEDEQETKKRIMYENTLRFPPHVSSDAVSFIKTALAKNAAMRPSASELVRHAWVRPYLAQLAQTHGVDVTAALKAPAPPALKTSISSNARISTGAPINNSARSASFTSVQRLGLGNLHISVGDAESINTGPSRHFVESPTQPTTPGPYGPPGMSRKPIWEADRSSVSFTAVKTTSLGGDATPSSPTSPRAVPPSNRTSGGAPLLKAALNANLNRIHTSTNGSGGGAAPPPGAGSTAVSGNVKQRLKEYFVARNT